MSKNIIAISAIVGATAALAVCLIFFYFVYKPGQIVDARPIATPIPQNPSNSNDEIPNPEIKAADVKSVSINTVYKGYFAAGNLCAKTYNEYFGDDDGIASPSSPCRVEITYDRDGHATRSVEISRWDKAAKEKRAMEKADSTATITPEQFNSLAQTIVTNEAFRSWREGTMITVSNCSISVTHTGGIKTVMSNVDERTTAYLPMVEAFKNLEKDLNWKMLQ